MDEVSTEVSTLFSKGVREIRARDYINAEALLTKALQELRKIPNSEDKKILKLSIYKYLGTSYFYQRKYQDAEETWTLGRVLSNIYKLSEEAVFLSQLSRHELYSSKEELREAYGKAKAACYIAETFGREDLTWFTHRWFQACLYNPDLPKLTKRYFLSYHLKNEWKYFLKELRNANLYKIKEMFFGLVGDWIKINSI